MNYEKLCFEAIEAVKDAGNFIRRERENFDRAKTEIKSANQLVSYVDVTAEQMLVKGLDVLLEDCAFITEENTIEQNADKPFKWIIDPLDGTTNFIHGVPAFSISVGLLEDNELVLGIVYELNRDECFYAWKGGPAYMNGAEIKVSTAEKLEDSLLATGFPYYEFKRMDAYIESLKEYMRGTRGLRRLGSAAVDLAYTACGRFEGFFEYGLNAWDVAGGVFILKQAGGVVSDFSGGDNYLFGHQIVASCPEIFDEFSAVLKKNFKK